MKQSGVLLILVTFVVAVSFVVASEQYKQGRMATTTLTGLNEVPTFGDPDGTGLFKFTVNSTQNQICYELTTAYLATITGMQINTGDRGVAGPTFIALQVPTNSSAKECLSVEADKLSELAKDPTRYYITVQSSEFPNGAIRGQLGR